MNYLTKPPNKQTTKESTTSKTLSLPITTWAQLEQIRTAHRLKDFEHTIMRIASEEYTKLGFGLP